jgi:hypothetical protein
MPSCSAKFVYNFYWNIYPFKHKFCYHIYQLWTIYLEFMAGQLGNNSNAEQQATIFNVLVDFWSKITPSVLQLVAHSTVVSKEKKTNKNFNFLFTLITLLF